MNVTGTPIGDNLRRIGAAALLYIAASPAAYGADTIQLPAPPNDSPPMDFVTGVGGSLGPIFLSGELVQGFRFTDNLQEDATEIPGIEYIPSVTLTGVATRGGATVVVTGTYSNEYPIEPDLPIANDTGTLTASAILPLAPSTTLNTTLNYSETFIENFTPGQFQGDLRDDILNYGASASLSHQTQHAFVTATGEYDEFITDISSAMGPYRSHSKMDRAENRFAAQGGIIGQNGHRYYLSAEANRFAYEAAELRPHDSVALKLGAGLSGTFGDFTVHAEALGFHKSFRRGLPDVVDVEASLSLQWKPRDTTTLMVEFGRVFEETSLLDSTGIDSNQLYVSWRERPTDKLYVQGTFMYSVFNVRELNDQTDGWKVYLDLAYAVTPHIYAKLSASHANQRTEAAGIEFSGTQIEVTSHFTF